MTKPFCVNVHVRNYEVDTQGHLNQAVYTQYAEHARWELFKAAGLDSEILKDQGIAPVLLKFSIRFRAELMAGDEVRVGCALTWRGRTFDLVQTFERADSKIAARLEGTGGILDRSTRSLLTDPGARLRPLLPSPALLGL